MERLDVLVIGGGSAGSETAFRLGETRRLRVGLVERDRLGGECNNYGCVPTKAMLKAAKTVVAARGAEAFGIRVRDVSVDFGKVMERVRGIVAHFSRYGPAPFEEIGVRVWVGPTARFASPHEMAFDDGERVAAERIVIATGTKAAVPPIPGLAEAGFWTNEEAADPPRLPESIAIVGAGPIGVEFAQIFARFGSRVTVIEALDRVLPPEDPDASSVLEEALADDGIEVLTSARIEAVERVGQDRRLRLAGGRTVDAAEILVAAGRTPSFALLDPAQAGVELDGRGRPVLDAALRTTAPHVFCAGDATGESLFTHTASYEGQVVARQILTGRRIAADYRVVPRVTYTDPEIASVGLTELQAREQGIDATIGRVDFADSERAFIEGDTRGFVKVVADARGGEIVGGHIAGAGAGELIHEIVALMAGRTPAAPAAAAIHAYPTLAEAVKGALDQVAG